PPIPLAAMARGHDRRVIRPFTYSWELMRKHHVQPTHRQDTSRRLRSEESETSRGFSLSDVDPTVRDSALASAAWRGRRAGAMVVSDWTGSFGALTARLRTTTGLTQEQLAERSGLSVRAISSIECGARHPRRFTVERLGTGLGLPERDRAALLA